MLGSEFVKQYATAGLGATESAAIALAREEAEGRVGGNTGLPPNLTPWPWFDLHLRAPNENGGSDTATLSVMTDVLSLGPYGDHLRLPMTPSGAQSICNLFGWLLPTPWLVYQIWRASPYKLAPIAMVPNKGWDLYQFADHSARIDAALDDKLAPGASVSPRPAGAVGGSVAGIKKSIVVSNDYQPGKLVIFGWYQPSPPFPDVFNDRKPWQDPTRQPRQVLSNAHGDFYIDYSHGIRPVSGSCIVNGKPMATADLYQHPTLSRLVSNETPSSVRVVRYPAAVPPRQQRPAVASTYPASLNVVERVVPTSPTETTAYLDLYRQRMALGTPGGR